MPQVGARQPSESVLRAYLLSSGPLNLTASLPHLPRPISFLPPAERILLDSYRDNGPNWPLIESMLPLRKGIISKWKRLVATGCQEAIDLQRYWRQQRDRAAQAAAAAAALAAAAAAAAEAGAEGEGGGEGGGGEGEAGGSGSGSGAASAGSSRAAALARAKFKFGRYNYAGGHFEAAEGGGAGGGGAGGGDADVVGAALASMHHLEDIPPPPPPSAYAAQRRLGDKNCSVSFLGPISTSIGTRKRRYDFAALNNG